MTNICQDLSMHFLITKVLTIMVIKVFKMTSTKAVCILLQALTALIITESFPYKLVPNEDSIKLPVEKAAVLWLCRLEQIVNQLSKIDGNILLKYLLTRRTFSSCTPS